MTYHSRKFLNSKTGIAAIECHADMASKGCFVTVGISDCNRTVNLDFDFISSSDVPNATVDTASTVWDTGVWDTDVWGASDIYPFRQWNMASGLGYYGSYRIKTSSAITDIRYYSTTYVFEPGSVL